MNKLESELQRLYCLPEQEAPSSKSDGHPAINLISATGFARCCVISVEKGADWEQVAALYQGVQADLELPAPAISVSGNEGYQIWFSLAEPVQLQWARDFMAGLSGKYLSEIKTTKLNFRPAGDAELRVVSMVPARLNAADGWSAYIDPTMGSMFAEETWLPMAPSPDKQAGMLAGLKSITTTEFQRALAVLSSLAEMPAARSAHSSPIANNDAQANERCTGTSLLNIGAGFNDPESFLLAVMNDVSATADQRIAAAIALLPVIGKNAKP